MKIKGLQAVIYSIILISVGWVTFTYLLNINSIEIDTMSTATYIVDGDTFDIATGERIRLADIDTPERDELGYYEATEALSHLIFNKRVYLDIDDVYVYDTFGTRLVCCVYVDYDATHYLNVNKALWENGLAEVWDHPNEFNPHQWTLLAPKLGSADIMKLLLISMGTGIVLTIIIHLLLRTIWKHLPFARGVGIAVLGYGVKRSSP